MIWNAEAAHDYGRRNGVTVRGARCLPPPPRLSGPIDPADHSVSARRQQRRSRPHRRQAAGQKLGQQVFVDNRGGAGGVVGTDVAAKSTPDGYTLLVISVAHAVDPWIYKVPYDPIKISSRSAFSAPARTY